VAELLSANISNKNLNKTKNLTKKHKSPQSFI